MHPVLVELGPITIHSYGFLIAVGFLVGIATVKRLASTSSLNVDRVLDLAFWSLIIGFIGARLLFVITRLDYFLADPVSIFRVWEGGLVFFGGPIAVVPFILWYSRKHQLNIWKLGDVVIPGLAIAHSFGRIGCLAAGCCYGKPTGTDYGIQLKSHLVAANLRGVNLHPTQIYESAALLILFVGLIWVYKRKMFDGQVMLTYFMAYPIIRSIIEVYRGDLIRGFVVEGWLSTSQFISILVFAVATTLLLVRLRQVNAEA